MPDMENTTNIPTRDPLFDAARRAVPTDVSPINVGDRVIHLATNDAGDVVRRKTTVSGGRTTEDVIVARINGVEVGGDAREFISGRVSVLGFTWQRDTRQEYDSKDESWSLVDDVALIGMGWSVTNYGGDHTRTDTPWCGWRYGSGGPFGGDRAKYATRDEAMRACVPYMLARTASRITHARQELARVERVHAAAMAAYKAATKGGEPCKP